MRLEQQSGSPMFLAMALPKKQNRDIINAIIGVLLTLCAALGYETIVADVIAIVFVLYAVTLPISDQALFVVIGLTNTRALEIFGVSASVAICLLSSIFYLSKMKKINKKVLIWSFIYILYSLQFCIREAGITYGIVFPLKMIAVLFFYYFLSEDSNVQNRPIDFVYRSLFFYLLGAIGAALGSLGMSGRFAIAGNDSNALSLQMAFIIAVFSVCYFRLSLISAPKFACYISIAFIFGLMTGSRMFIVLAFGIILGTVFLNISKFHRTFWLLLILLLGVVAFFSTEYGQTALRILINRNEALIQQGNISNGRFDLWEQYIQYLNEKQYWLIGVGDYRITGIKQIAHNMIIEGIINYGVLGLIILWNIYRPIIKNIKRKTEKNRVKGMLFVYMPLLVVLIGNFVLHDLTNIYNTSMIFLSVILACGYKQECRTSS